MATSKARVVFGKNVDNMNQMEISLFNDNELLFSSKQATYLKDIVMLNTDGKIPPGWHELSDEKTLVSPETPYFDGNTLVPTSPLFAFSFFHYEKNEDVEYALPTFKEESEDEKKKIIRLTLINDDITGKLVIACITNKANSSFLFAKGGRHFVYLKKILKPLYTFGNKSAILSPGLEVPDDGYLMAWREANIEGKQNQTLFQVFKNMI